MAARQTIASGKDPIEEREAERSARKALAGPIVNQAIGEFD